jgi:hypothetical protein
MASGTSWRTDVFHRPPMTPATLFCGFVPYQQEQVEEFFSASERAMPNSTD